MARLQKTLLGLFIAVLFYSSVITFFTNNGRSSVQFHHFSSRRRPPKMTVLRSLQHHQRAEVPTVRSENTSSSAKKTGGERWNRSHVVSNLAGTLPTKLDGRLPTCFISQATKLSGIRTHTSTRGYISPEVMMGHKELMSRTYPQTPRRNRCDGCFPWTYRTLLPSEVCDDTSSVNLLVLVTTVPNNTEKRVAIRNTWGRFSTIRWSHPAVRHLFLFGDGWSDEEQQIIEEESATHGDVLQESYVDSYYNLSLKVLSGFRWALSRCRSAPYVLRTADDNFINVPNVLTLIQKHDEDMQSVITGECSDKVTPIRDIGSKWYVTQHEYPLPSYPPYCVGTAFLLSRQTAARIVRMSVNVPYYPIEDAYFGLVMNASYGSTGVTILPLDSFGHKSPGVDYKKGHCTLPDDWVSVHKVKPFHVPLIWKKCQDHKGDFGVV